MVNELLTKLREEQETPFKPADKADLKKREEERAAQRNKNGKLYYVDFESWRVRGMDEDDAAERAQAIQRRANGMAPEIVSVEPVVDDANTEYAGDELIEAKTPFQPASDSEIGQRRQKDYEKRNLQYQGEKEDFIYFLETTLIPDLRASGSDATAEDFAKAVMYMRAPELDEAAESPFKPAGKAELVKRKEQFEKEREAKRAAAHKAGKRICPHCDEDLYEAGIYSQEDVADTITRHYEWDPTKKVWDETDIDRSGDLQQVNTEQWYCENCGEELTEGEDFDIDESKVVEERE